MGSRASDHGTSGTLAALDRHGASLLLLVQVLIADRRRAEAEVASTLVAACQSRGGLLGGEPTRRDLGASLFRQSGFTLSAGGEFDRGCGHEGSDEVLGPLAEFPDRARVSLALCVYGGQSYTSAADLLGVPPEDVATDLTASLRHLLSLRVERSRPGARAGRRTPSPGPVNPSARLHPSCGADGAWTRHVVEPGSSCL